MIELPLVVIFISVLFIANHKYVPIGERCKYVPKGNNIVSSKSISGGSPAVATNNSKRKEFSEYIQKKYGISAIRCETIHRLVLSGSTIETIHYAFHVLLTNDEYDIIRMERG